MNAEDLEFIRSLALRVLEWTDERIERAGRTSVDLAGRSDPSPTEVRLQVSGEMLEALLERDDPASDQRQRDAVAEHRRKVRAAAAAGLDWVSTTGESGRKSLVNHLRSDSGSTLCGRGGAIDSETEQRDEYCDWCWSAAALPDLPFPMLRTRFLGKRWVPSATGTYLHLLGDDGRIVCGNAEVGPGARLFKSTKYCAACGQTVGLSRQQLDLVGDLRDEPERPDP